MTRKKKQLDSGYSLLEMLVSSAILIVLVNVCLVSYISFNRIRKSGEKTVDINMRIAEIESAFRENVRGAARTRDSFQDHQSSESLLILESRGGDVVSLLGVLDESEQFAEYRCIREGTEWTVDFMKYHSLGDAEYLFGTNGARGVQLTVKVDNEGRRNTVSATNTFLAVLRTGGS